MKPTIWFTAAASLFAVSIALGQTNAPPSGTGAGAPETSEQIESGGMDEGSRGTAADVERKRGEATETGNSTAGAKRRGSGMHEDPNTGSGTSRAPTDD